MSINKELKRFLKNNFPAVCDARKRDDKSWEDAIAQIIISQDKYIDALEGDNYQHEQIETADSEDSTFMDNKEEKNETTEG